MEAVAAAAGRPPADGAARARQGARRPRRASRVSWTASSDNVGVAGYGLYRNGAARRLVARHRPPPSPASPAEPPTRSRSTPTTPPATAPARRRSRPPRARAPGGGDTTAPSDAWHTDEDGLDDDVDLRLVGRVHRQRRRRPATASTGTAPRRARARRRARRSAASPAARATPLGVDAYDAAGNRSSPAVADDGDLRVPASDRHAGTVCAAGDGVRRDHPDDGGARAGTPRPTTSASPVTGSSGTTSASQRSRRPGYTYTGLTCGTSYTFAIEAYDAAGNVLQPLAGHRHDLDQRLLAPPPPPPPLRPGTRHREPLGRHQRRLLRPPGHARRLGRRPGLLLEPGVPGRPDRRRDPRPRRQLRQRDHRPEQAVDRRPRRHLPHRDRRERDRQRSRERPHRRRLGRQQHHLRRPRDGPHVPLRPASNIVVDSWNVDCNGCNASPDLPPGGREQRHRSQLGDPGQQQQQPDVGQRLEPDLREQPDPRRRPARPAQPRTRSASTPGTSRT